MTMANFGGKIGAMLATLCLVAVPITHAQGTSSPSLGGRYFMTVWAFQGPDDDVVHSHTFTSFYRGDDLARGLVRPRTISWLPATGIVQPFGSENGRNFSLAETLAMACRRNRDVKSWGPFEIRPELYRSATRRLQLLESGRVRYAMMGAPGAMNCITAAGDLTPQRLDTGILWGVAASAAVVRHLSPYVVGTIDIKGLTPRACGAQAGSIARGSDGERVR